MEERKNPFRNIRVIVRPSTPMLKLAIILLIVFSMVALITLGLVNTNIRQRTEDMRQEAAKVEQENADLQEKIDDLGSSQSVQDIAESQLGLVDPDTVIINPNSQ